MLGTRRMHDKYETLKVEGSRRVKESVLGSDDGLLLC